jgi:hypothetical protein
LKADPKNLLKKYFDIQLYYANWGTRIVAFKVPTNVVDFALLKQYDNNETVRVTQSGNDVLVRITANCEDAEEWWEVSQKISKYVSLRDDIMAGDYRCLYIAWLAGYNEQPKKKTLPTPPIPSGMKKLSGTLQSFIDFMYLDAETVNTAVESANAEELPEPTLKEIKDWVANLPEEDWQKILVELIQEKTAAQIIQRELKNRFLKERKTNLQKSSCPKKPLKK